MTKTYKKTKKYLNQTTTNTHMPIKFAKLNLTFLITSIVGFLFSIIYLPKISVTWAFTLAIVFLIMFIAVMISETSR